MCPSPQYPTFAYINQVSSQPANTNVSYNPVDYNSLAL